VERRANPPSLHGKTVLLTGGTGGIGAELVGGLVRAGARVLLACRDPAKGHALAATIAQRTPGAGASILVTSLDLARLASVTQWAQQAAATHDRIDGLIHNAGVWPRQRRLTADGFELAFGTNHLGPFALTQALLPTLRRGRARVVFVASGLAARGRLEWDDLMQTRGGFNGVRAYQQSKLANVMCALALARRYPELTSLALHPGVVRTGLTLEYPEMWKSPPPQLATAASAAAAVLHLVSAPGLRSGCYFDREREQAPAAAARVMADQDRLWQVSEQLISQATARSTPEQ
jgi:NAD(P)-dependent dehydrogenase (short-subunit alcohol dehydrogenase family)